MAPETNNPMPTNGPICAAARKEHMSRIRPNLELKRFGLGDGWINVTPDGVSITICFETRQLPILNGHEGAGMDDDATIMLDPECAPLFRMIANRLDEISKNRAAVA